MSKEVVTYDVMMPRMDRSVPECQVPYGSYGLLAGVDGRYAGGLRKYFGNTEVLDLDDVSGMGDIDTYDGPSFVKKVAFLKKGTSTVVHGFVVRWDSADDNDEEQVDLIYTENNGTSWTKLAIYATGLGISNTDYMSCIVDGAFLYVYVDGQTPQTVYWSGSAYTVVDAGPGVFSATIGALTESSTSVDSSYELNGKGTYQIAWRFYDSSRGIYSALSDPVTVTLDHTKTTKATGTISFNSGGGDSGLLVDGDIITINGRTYEADSNSSITSDVAITITSLTTITQMVTAVANAINGDSSAVVTARIQSSSVLLEAKTRGSGGNAYGLSVTETGANTDDLTVSGSTLTGGGAATTEAEEHCKIVLDFPNNAAVLSGKTYTHFNALFDTVDIFRTINLGDSPSTLGAIFYLEQSISKTGNWATSGAWDSLQVTVGTKLDDAMPFQTMYDPEKDIVTSPPQSGAAGRYGGMTFAAEAASTAGGYATLNSSPLLASGEYFTTYNRREGTPGEGRPLTFIEAGDSLFQLSAGAVVHIFKQGDGRPLQYTVLHRNRGLVGQGAAHAAGNSVFMICPMGLVILNANDGSMAQVASVDRVLSDDWSGETISVQSGYDSKMNCSCFLNPDDEEALLVWHSTQVSTVLKGANFACCTDGTDIDGSANHRVYLVTSTGLIVRPDDDRSGSGTMWGLSSSYTLDGTATSTGSSLVDADATFHADMVGAKLYMTSGDNAGEARTISAVDVGNTTLTLSSAFDNTIAVGDTYSISPVPFVARWSKLRTEEAGSFDRWNVKTINPKSIRHGAGVGTPNNKWRISIYRNGSSVLSSSSISVTMNESPDEAAAYLNLDGIDVEPYLEQISSGSDFEVVGLRVSCSKTDSREIG